MKMTSPNKQNVTHQAPISTLDHLPRTSLGHKRETPMTMADHKVHIIVSLIVKCPKSIRGPSQVRPRQTRLKDVQCNRQMKGHGGTRTSVVPRPTTVHLMPLIYSNYTQSVELDIRLERICRCHDDAEMWAPLSDVPR